MVTYRYAGEQHSLHFCIVDTFTQAWYSLQGTFLYLYTCEHTEGQLSLALTIACSDSNALYTKGKTSILKVSAQHMSHGPVLRTFSEDRLLRLVLQHLQVI